MGTTMQPSEWLALFLGEIKYRPPTGKAEDRMLALATGKTESGGPVVNQKTDRRDAESV